MNNKKIFLSSPTMHGEEREFIDEAFESNWVAPLGKNVNEFENEIARFVGVNDAAALSAGTAALHLAAILCDVKQDDIVICPALTFSATVNPISYEKGNQVFVDSEYETWNMDPKALRLALEKYPNAKAVFLVNLYGTPAKIDEIKEICNEFNVPLVEDAAESLGALYKGRQTGSFGDYGVFSFNGNKIITTSGGGMLVSNNVDGIKKARFLATQARDNARHYQHSEIGYNYRMSNIVAGIGRGQLIHLNEHIDLKKKIYFIYKVAFKDIPEISMNPYLIDSVPNYWLSCILLDSTSTVTPIDILMELEKENIESRPIWKPMQLQPVFSGHDFITINKGISVSEDIYNRGLCLPSDIKNTEEDMNTIIRVIRKCFNK